MYFILINRGDKKRGGIHRPATPVIAAGGLFSRHSRPPPGSLSFRPGILSGKPLFSRHFFPKRPGKTSGKDVFFGCRYALFQHVYSLPNRMKNQDLSHKCSLFPFFTSPSHFFTSIRKFPEKNEQERSSHKVSRQASLSP